MLNVLGQHCVNTQPYGTIVAFFPPGPCVHWNKTIYEHGCPKNWPVTCHLFHGCSKNWPVTYQVFNCYFNLCIIRGKLMARKWFNYEHPYLLGFLPACKFPVVWQALIEQVTPFLPRKVNASAQLKASVSSLAPSVQRQSVQRQYASQGFKATRYVSRDIQTL